MKAKTQTIFYPAGKPRLRTNNGLLSKLAKTLNSNYPKILAKNKSQEAQKGKTLNPKDKFFTKRKLAKHKSQPEQN